MSGDLDTLAAAQFPSRFQDLRLLKIESKMHFLPTGDYVIAVERTAGSGLVQAQLLSIFEQVRINVARRENFKLCSPGSDGDGTAGTHINFDIGWLRRRLFDCHFLRP